MKYTVVAISGSHGPLISDTINAFGSACSYNSTGADQGHAILITYPWELYEYVMTQHFIVTVLEPYNQGNKENFENFKPKMHNGEKFTDPNNINHTDWALHVIDAYKHIGTGDVLNGVKSSLLTRIDENLPYSEIKLFDIINDKDKVLSQLADIVGKPLTNNVAEFFKNGYNDMDLKMRPYLETLKDVKSEFRVDMDNSHVFNYIHGLEYPGPHPTE